MSGYHGVKPVTEDDRKMASKHLKLTKKLAEDRVDLLSDKIEDHRKALKKALKDKDKESANYNRSHMASHEHERDDAYGDEKEINRSLQTLGSMHTHSRKTYNDVRKAKVKLMYIKSGAKDNG
jgi:hypothetical protein